MLAVARLTVNVAEKILQGKTTGLERAVTFWNEK